MGFLDYARNISFEKDPLKLKIITEEDIIYPLLSEEGPIFKVTLPVPKFNGTSLSFIGYEFTDNPESRQLITCLFRSSVFHLSCHAILRTTGDYQNWINKKNLVISNFVTSLVEDLRVNTFIAEWYPDRLKDLSYSCGLVLKRLRDIENIRIQATRIMASILLYANTGMKRFTSKHDLDVIDDLFNEMDRFKDVISMSNVKEETDISDEKLNIANIIYNTILEHGPIIEAPSLPFTEYLGPSSLFPSMKVNPNSSLVRLYNECIDGLSGNQSERIEESSKIMVESEALQAFDAQLIEYQKDQKILTNYEKFTNSRFSSIGFPLRDYTEYLRAKMRCKKSTNKLVERLFEAMNEYSEDIRKMYGVIDLTDAIQVIASNSDRTDVFLVDDKIQKRFAWSILIDASLSMNHIRDYTRDIAITLAETASKILKDAASWSVFAFNDRFEIIKDFTEQYNTKVKSRLGGLEFKGLTYMPDAMEIAGWSLGKQREELKILVVVSDGTPFGYTNIYPTTNGILKDLKAAEIAVIGIGVQSDQMEFIFNSYVTTYTMKDFVNRFGQRYTDTYEYII